MARSSNPNHSSRRSAYPWRLRISCPVQARLNSSRNFFTTWYQSSSNDAAPCQAKKPAIVFCSERCPSVKINHRRATKALFNSPDTTLRTTARLHDANMNAERRHSRLADQVQDVIAWRRGMSIGRWIDGHTLPGLLSLSPAARSADSCRSCG